MIARKSLTRFGLATGLALLLVLPLLGGLSSVSAATALSPGDIAIIGVNADNPDDFAFVLLVDIQVGTEIRFTDSGWLSTDSFRGGEGAVKYTAPSDLSAGTIISYVGNAADFVADNDATVGTSGLNLSASGDQVIAFQGLSTSPALIFAVQTNSNQWQTDSDDSNQSDLPLGLVNGTTAVAVGADSGAESEYDNSVYDMSMTGGTQAELLAAIGNNANWNGNNSSLAMPSGSFTVFTGPYMSISKSAPDIVKADQAFDYTITVRNRTGITPTTTTITDVLPTGVDYISASDGGTELGGMVTWLITDLADGDTVTRTFQVTATAAHGEAIENVDYGVNGGADWTTTTIGTRNTSYVADCSSIYNVQYPGGNSLCMGETVEVTGTVYAVYYGSDFAMADASGAWHGIYVDNSSDTPNVGDVVRVQGDVEEYYNFTRIAWTTHTVLFTDTTPYAASVISTAGASSAEAYESVLVEVQDVIVTDNDLGNGEWEVDDGSGATAVDDMAYAYASTTGDALDLVRGMLNYSYSAFKIEPRDANDVVLASGAGLLVSKDAPEWTPPGETFTYTLTVENQTAQLLNDLTVSDTLPLSVTYASSNPAGNWDGDTITWTAASLAHGDTLSYTIVVTAPTAMTAIDNTDYAAWASNWLTPTVGAFSGILAGNQNCTIYSLSERR